MSCNPKGESPCGNAPTAHVPCNVFHRSQQSCPEGGSLPQGHERPSVPRAAYYHSSSVGRRFPDHRQYSSAWLQLTQLMG
jgi:hypothetical protein